MGNIDSDKLQQFSVQTGNMVASGFNCAISLIGDRLNLYKSLYEIGPCDSHRLAGHLGLSERWVREWLHHQACLNQILFHEESGTFELSPEAFAVLVDEDVVVEDVVDVVIKRSIRSRTYFKLIIWW